MHLRTRASVSSITAALLLAAGPGSPAVADPGGPTTEAGATTGLRATFDTSVQGYEAGGGTTVSWSPTGGRPDGHLVAQASAMAYPYVRTRSVAGDRSSAYGGTLSLDTRFSAGSGVVLYVYLFTDGAQALYRQEEPDSPSQWERGSYTLAPGEGWLDGTGSPASQADFDTVLGDLARLEVYGLTPSTGSTMRLDNVKLASRVRRTVTLRYAQQRFVGRVTGGCTVGQPVTVFRVAPGPDQIVGRATTDRNAEYRVPRRATGARYYARIGQRYRNGQGDCLADTSPVTRFG